MLLSMNDGKKYQEIIDFLGCYYRSVAKTCVHGYPDNLKSLKDKIEKRNYRKATEEYVQLLMQIIEKELS